MQADELTVKELLALVKYWTHVVIDAMFFYFSTCIDSKYDRNACDDADANIKAAARLLGKEVLDAAVLEAEGDGRRYKVLVGPSDRLTAEDKMAIHAHRDALAELVRSVEEAVAS